MSAASEFIERWNELNTANRSVRASVSISPRCARSKPAQSTPTPSGFTAEPEPRRLVQASDREGQI
jgi:hypothetical protein